MFTAFKKAVLIKTIFFACADAIIVAFSILLAFELRFDFNIPSDYITFIYKMIGLCILFILPVFYFQKLYSFSWSYVSANELVSLFKATTISFIFLSAAIFISHYFPHFMNFPRSVIFMSYILVFVLCGALRFYKRILRIINNKGNISEKDRTIIVGAGDAGEQILRSITSSGRSPYSPVGFVDDNPVKQGIVIHGLHVFGRISELPHIIRQKNIKQLIVALPSAGSKKIKESVAIARKAGVWKIKIVPPISEIISGHVSFKNLKDVDVEDLLGREEIVLDLKEIERLIKNKSVLITGAAGSIGSELCRQVAKFNPKKIIVLDQDETGVFNISSELKNKFPLMNFNFLVGDILDNSKMKKIFSEFKPSIVFHAAAYKHVPLMEENISEAVKNNIFGTKVLAELSIENNVEKFVFISTDKAVNPVSIMGATKRVGEALCQSLNRNGVTKFISVRFGNVLNSRGSVIPIFREQIKKGGPIEVTDPEMKRYFMLISEACLLVMQAGAMGKGGEVFVLDMGKPVKIVDLAREMIKLSGLEPDKDIPIVFTGLRPGEKMFEEILTAEEGTSATQNKKIFMAKLSEVNMDDFKNIIERLWNSIYSNDSQILEILKEIVPSFKHE